MNKRRLGRCFKSRSFTLGFVLVGFIALIALLSYFYTPVDPNAMDIPSRLQGPGGHYWFGTDQFGRDIFSRIMRGAVNSLFVGLVSVGISISIGTALGMLAGYSGRWLDEAVMRIVDTIYGFPAVLLAILVTSILGPGIRNSVIAIGVSYIPFFARVTRGSFLSLKEREFVAAAKALGRSDTAISIRHLLPNTFPILIVQATVIFALAIIVEAALSYLGLGTQPPDPSWGRMLKEAQSFMRISPWPAIFPGLAIVTAVLGFNLLGDGLRDILDPRMTFVR